MLMYIENWQQKNLTCHFCGEKRSVKYYTKVATGTGFTPSRLEKVPCCNKCALTLKVIENHD